jgi:anaerobic dimethyl sulfoxide reductase subunit B (iron-sulfur subunit)
MGTVDKTYGLLIDYEYCTKCQSCEVACKEEHNLPVGKWGIRVQEDGPWEIEPGQYNFNYLPFPTDLCNLCAERTAVGREPSCVHHCLANVMQYGTVEELAVKLAEKTKQVLFVPQYKPYAAKGKFEPKYKFDPTRHSFEPVEVAANENFTTSSQRADQRTATGIEE